jgi:hypothetical protein
VVPDAAAMCRSASVLEIARLVDIGDEPGLLRLLTRRLWVSGRQIGKQPGRRLRGEFLEQAARL